MNARTKTHTFGRFIQTAEPQIGGLFTSVG
jgi:hypothetical protein